MDSVNLVLLMRDATPWTALLSSFRILQSIRVIVTHVNVRYRKLYEQMSSSMGARHRWFVHHRHGLCIRYDVGTSTYILTMRYIITTFTRAESYSPITKRSACRWIVSSFLMLFAMCGSQMTFTYCILYNYVIAHPCLSVLSTAAKECSTRVGLLADRFDVVIPVELTVGDTSEVLGCVGYLQDVAIAVMLTLSKLSTGHPQHPTFIRMELHQPVSFPFLQIIQGLAGEWQTPVSYCCSYRGQPLAWSLSCVPGDMNRRNGSAPATPGWTRGSSTILQEYTCCWRYWRTCTMEHISSDAVVGRLVQWSSMEYLVKRFRKVQQYDLSLLCCLCCREDPGLPHVWTKSDQ